MSTTNDPALRDVGAGYSRTAKDYDRGVLFNISGGQRLVMSLPDGPHRKVLDVGCGTGLASLAMIARFHPDHVTGVDPSEGMLEEFQRKLHEADSSVDVTLKAADVMDMGVEPASFDTVVSTMAFHWFPDKPGATREMARALRPRGILGILNSGRFAEHEFRDVLAGIDLPAARVWDSVFDAAQRDIPEMEEYVEQAGLDPLDIWMERRIRRTSVDAYLERMRIVASHLFRDFSEEEVAEIFARAAEGMRNVSGPRGFQYTFTKVYTVARKPG